MHGADETHHHGNRLLNLFRIISMLFSFVTTAGILPHVWANLYGPANISTPCERRPLVTIWTLPVGPVITGGIAVNGQMYIFVKASYTGYAIVFIAVIIPWIIRTIILVMQPGLVYRSV